MDAQNQPLPERFADIKREIASSIPNFQERATRSWTEILQELQLRTDSIIKDGPEVILEILIHSMLYWLLAWQFIPQISFKDLTNLKPEEREAVRRKGCIVIKDVVDDAEAKSWKESLEEFVKLNPNVDGG